METMQTLESDLKEKIAKTNPDHKEGKVAKTIEEQTAKLPSDTFLWAALGSMAASLTLKLMRKDETALFIGQWAPSFLLLGIYNKMVKQEGHDKTSKKRNATTSSSISSEKGSSGQNLNM